MNEATEIQDRLTALPCPICKKAKYVLTPKGNQSYSETLHTAQCLSCKYSFQVGIPNGTFAQSEPDTQLFLRGLLCPSCEEQGADLNFRCHPTVRDAYYFVTCQSCKHPFKERAPMEAYE